MTEDKKPDNTIDFEYHFKQASEGVTVEEIMKQIYGREVKPEESARWARAVLLLTGHFMLMLGQEAATKIRLVLWDQRKQQACEKGYESMLCDPDSDANPALRIYCIAVETAARVLKHSQMFEDKTINGVVLVFRQLKDEEELMVGKLLITELLTIYREL